MGSRAGLEAGEVGQLAGLGRETTRRLRGSNESQPYTKGMEPVALLKVGKKEVVPTSTKGTLPAVSWGKRVLMREGAALVSRVFGPEK